MIGADNPSGTLDYHQQPPVPVAGFSDPQGSGVLRGLTPGELNLNKGGAAYFNRLTMPQGCVSAIKKEALNLMAKGNRLD